MKKIILSAVFVTSIFSAAAALASDSVDCSLTTFFDPAISKSTVRTIERAMKHKGYTAPPHDAMEQYRLAISDYGTFVRFYFQEFDAPNYDDVIKVDQPTNGNRDAIIMQMLATVPNCGQ